MQQQKQERFLKLYKGVHDRFERFCRARACGDMPYEDLMNESLLIAFQKIDQLEKESSFLHKALTFLPEAQREALILFEITGFSVKEIAELQDSSEAAVKQRLSRGRKGLAAVIKNKLQLKTGDTL